MNLSNSSAVSRLRSASRHAAGTYSLKPWFQGLLRPFVRALHRAGIRANQVTLAACALSVATGWLLLTSRDVRLFLLLPGIMLVRMALNAMDGMLAREFDQQTRLGVFLNELCDVVSDTFLYLPFAHLRGFSPFWVWNVVVMSVISEMAGIISAMIGVARRYDGPMGKTDRAIVFGALGMWAGLTGRIPSAVANLLPKILVALLALTVLNRTRNALREAELEKDGQCAAL